MLDFYLEHVMQVVLNSLGIRLNFTAKEFFFTDESEKEMFIKKLHSLIHLTLLPVVHSNMTCK